MAVDDEALECFPSTKQIYSALDNFEQLRELTKTVAKDDLEFALNSSITSIVAAKQNPARFIRNFAQFVNSEIGRVAQETLPATDRLKALWNAFWSVVEEIAKTVHLDFLPDCVAVLEQEIVTLKEAYDNVVQKRISLEYKEVQEELRREEEIKRKKKEEKDQETRRKKEEERQKKEEEKRKDEEEKQSAAEKKKYEEDLKAAEKEDITDADRQKKVAELRKKEEERLKEEEERKVTAEKKKLEEEAKAAAKEEAEKKESDEPKEKEKQPSMKKLYVMKTTTDEDAMRKHMDTSILGLLGVFRVMQTYCGECPDRAVLKSRVLLLLGRMLPIDSRSLANYSRQKVSFTLPSLNDIKTEMDGTAEPIAFVRDEDAIKARSGEVILQDLEKDDLELERQREKQNQKQTDADGDVSMAKADEDTGAQKTADNSEVKAVSTMAAKKSYANEEEPEEAKKDVQMTDAKKDEDEKEAKDEKNEEKGEEKDDKDADKGKAEKTEEKKDGESGVKAEKKEDPPKPEITAYKDTKDGKVEVLAHTYLWKAFHIMQEPDKTLDSANFTEMDSVFNTVLTHFEKHRPIRENADPKGAFPPLPLRFLPKYEKFQLQVRSEPFQTKVLSSFCIFFNSLELDSRKDEPDNPRSIARLDDDRKSAFHKLKRRTWHLLDSVSPSFCKLLAANLSKETDWVVWKKGNCKEVERFYFRDPEELEPVSKRRRLSTVETDLTIPDYMDTLLNTLSQDVCPSQKVEPKNASDQKAVALVFFNQLWNEDLPENMIEEPYKMKNNKVFMWQARRAYCRHHLSTHGEMCGGPSANGTTDHKNDFMGSVAKVVKQENGVEEKPVVAGVTA